MTTTLRTDPDARRRGGEPVGAAGEGVRVRWGLPADDEKVSELLELNGISRRMVYEERFIVAEKDGHVVAAVAYRTESKRLLLGRLLVDPWADERVLAVALYAGAGKLAREMGVRKVRARTEHRAKHPSGAGYRRRLGGWRLDVPRVMEDRAPGQGGR